METSVKEFFTLMQIALGTHGPDMGRALSDDDWQKLYVTSKKHSLDGLFFRAIDRLPADQIPSKRPMMRIFADAQKIKSKNARYDEALQGISNHFQEAGFPAVLLKGQGLGTLYDDPGVRVCGDVDLWLDGSVKDIIAFVKSENPNPRELFFHHIDCREFDGIEVEAHFMPSWMNSPIEHRKLMRWFDAQKPKQFENKIEIKGEAAEGDERQYAGSIVAVPTLEFNRIYVLLHIYRHLFQEGIGLRQLVDYYYVLTKGFTADEKAETLSVIKSLKMTRFASAVLWVLREVFAMDPKFFLMEPNEKEGRFLLSEIMQAGNFGHFDSRNERSSNSELSQFSSHIKRLVRFVTHYPTETLWSPFFKLYHFFWRRSH